MHFVYILQSQRDKKCYTGITQDVQRRLLKHNAGGVRSTSHRRPFRVIYQEPHNSRAEARAREKYLKSYAGSKEKLAIIEAHTQ